jgi:hypothetical protein
VTAKRVFSCHSEASPQGVAEEPRLCNSTTLLTIAAAMNRCAAGTSWSLSMKEIGGISPSRFFSGALPRLLQNDRGF